MFLKLCSFDMHPKPCAIRGKPSRILYSTLKSTSDKKDIFLRYFYQHAEFISSGKHNLPGTLADVDIEGNKINSGFLAFLRLIGTVYFKKHSSGFPLLQIDVSIIPIHYNSTVVGLMISDKPFGIGYNLRVR